MTFESIKIRLPLWVILVVALSIATLTLYFMYMRIDDSQVKMIGIIGGLISGLAVYLATFITLLRPMQQLDRFQRSGFKALLANRHDRIYYRNIVADAERTVRVLGASCTRFVEDFLDTNSDDKVLIDALRSHRRLVVELLIPRDKFMGEEARARAKSVEQKIGALAAEFGTRVQIRRFNEPAHHSFVIVDNDLIAGPIFESDKSKYAPAVHVTMSTPFAQKYNHHFEDVWNACDPTT